MEKTTLPNGFFYLTVAGIVLGIVSGIIDSEILGLTVTEWLYGGAGGALLAATFMITGTKEVRRPPCPTCPPFCLWFRWLALGFYIIAVIVAWFLGEWFLGVHASGWYIIFVAFGVLTIGGYLKCFLMSNTSS